MEDSLINQILDEDNTDNIILYDNDNNPVEFMQIAVIPYNDDLYVILKPATKIEGIDDDEALVFLLDEENDDVIMEEDEKIVDAIFESYYKLLDEQA